MKKSVLAAVAMVACLAVGSVASAAVIYNEGGTGFVGKGDVQVALDYNNAQLQANADSLIFTYEERAEYTLVCSGHPNSSQNPKTFKNKAVSVNATIAFEARKNSQEKITGFTLTGLGNEVADGNDCPTPWTTLDSRELNDDADAIIGLFVNGVQIWAPVPAE